MLKDKVAVITGSTSGIGLGIAKKLSQSGCHIVLNGFGDAKAIEAIRQGLEKESKRQVLYHGANMTKPDEIGDLITSTIKKLGSLDIVVNNAGIQHVSPIEDFPPEMWDAILAINLSASFHTIRHAIPEMKKNKWGRIINIASAHALVASPFKAAYVAAKHGLAGLTKVVALEGAEFGITCNAICPGYVKTPLVENQIVDTAKARGISAEEVIRDVMLGEQPTKQFVTVDQIAAFAHFLCTPEAVPITGSLLSIDGGWTAH
jgi:3-hydroxybutyrate dehydrogenase